MVSIYWLIAIAVFLVIEIATLGLTTVWFAGGALIAFVASLLGLPIFFQLIIFSVVSFGLLFFTRPIAMKHFNNHREKTNYESIVGTKGRVTETIDNVHQKGTVVLNGQEWTARALEDKEIIEVGALVEVEHISGVKLVVKQVS